MKTSTKVVIKFQIFTTVIIFFVLLVVNIAFFKLWISQYDAKIHRITSSPAFKNWTTHWGKFRNWQKVKNDCFTMYGKKFCLTNYIWLWIYKQWNHYFYYKNWVVFDVSDFITFFEDLLRLSVWIFVFYLIFSYFLWRLFLQTIYKRIFKAVEDLQKRNYININSMRLSENDELRVLFETINKQIDAISSFNKYLSHEIKTPLMKILSAIDLLSLKCDDKKIPELKKELFFIKDIIDSLNKLILIETKNYQIKKEPFDICKYLQDYSKILGLEISIQCGLKNREVLTSKELFSLVLKNILENAKKYSKWEVKVVVTDKYIIFENRSDKINDVSKLTDKFYKESNKWLGIGLYLVEKICEILWYKLEISYGDWFFKVKILF